MACFRLFLTDPSVLFSAKHMTAKPSIFRKAEQVQPFYDRLMNHFVVTDEVPCIKRIQKAAQV